MTELQTTLIRQSGHLDPSGHSQPQPILVNSIRDPMSNLTLRLQQVNDVDKWLNFYSDIPASYFDNNDASLPSFTYALTEITDLQKKC